MRFFAFLFILFNMAMHIPLSEAWGCRGSRTKARGPDITKIWALRKAMCSEKSCTKAEECTLTEKVVVKVGDTDQNATATLSRVHFDGFHSEKSFPFCWVSIFTNLQYTLCLNTFH